MRGTLLDARGSFDGQASIKDVREALLRRGKEEQLSSILHNLERSREEEFAREAGILGGYMRGGHLGSMQSWRETLYTTIADGTQILNTATETIMIPDYTLPAGYLYPGRTLKYTLFGDESTIITTPGTLTIRLRYGGVAGTVLAASGAFAPDPTAASTNQSICTEFYVVCRAVGTAAASYTMGKIVRGDIDDASAATIVGNLNMMMVPATAPASVNINTTTANALSPTWNSSSSTATTQYTNHLAILEALT